MLKKFFYFVIICIISNIAVCFLVCSFYRQYYEIHLLSTVKTPVFLFLNDIKKDFDDENIDSARAKFLFFNNEWHGFYSSRNVKYGMGDLLLKWQRNENLKSTEMIK